MDKAFVAAALAALVLPACRASVSVNAKASGEGQPQTEEASAPAPPLPPMVLETAYFGVARSLTLRPAERPATCACLQAAVGPASDPAFDWRGEAPAVGSDALVVAISAEGVACDSKGRGPSIAAVDRSGNDVVVVIEEFKETRPLALGAIIPNPGSGGRIFLRPRGKIPYGRPIGASEGTRRDMCLIGRGSEGAQPPSPDDLPAP